MKIFLSMPMRNKTDLEIQKMIDEMWSAKFIKITTDDIIITHGYNKDRKDMNPIEALGESIKEMADCNAVMFYDWCCYDSNYRGCNVEYAVAKRYGLARLNYNAITGNVTVID